MGSRDDWQKDQVFERPKWDNVNLFYKNGTWLGTIRYHGGGSVPISGSWDQVWKILKEMGAE